MHSPFAVLADQIYKHPKIVTIAVILFMILMFYGASMTYMKTGTETYVDIDTPAGSLLLNYQNQFSSSSIILIIESDDVTSVQNIEYIDALEEDIRNEQYIISVSSIVDLLKQANGGVLPTNDAEVSAIIARTPPEVLENILASKQLTFVIVPLETGTSSDTATVVINNIESLVENSAIPPGLAVTVGGSPAFEKEMQEEINESMAVLILAAMILMVIAVGLLFSHVKYRFLPVATVFLGLVTTFGIMGITGIPLGMTVIGAFPVLIGVGIDYAIQFHSRIEEETERRPLQEALSVTITNAGPSVMAAMIATSIGFLVMLISPLPMVRDFGITCTIGVFACYIAALIVVPTFARLVGYESKSRERSETTDARLFMKRYDAFLGRVSVLMANKAVIIVVFFTIFAMAGYQLDSTIPIDTDEETFVPQDMPALNDLKKITRTAGATETLPIDIRGDYVYDPVTLAWIQGFQEYEVSTRPEIIDAASIVTLIETYNNGVLPTSQTEIDEVLARIPESEKDRYNHGNMETIIQFTTADIDSRTALTLIGNIRSDITFVNPPAGITVTATGSTTMFADLINDINDSKNTMTFLGFLVISAYLLAIYRKILAISPIIPIIMIVGWNSLIMKALGINYTPMTAVLGSMTIGIACEYTILIMERYNEEREGGGSVMDSIRMSVQKIGTAITVSGLTTVFGFSALTLSAFNMISNFGTTTVITVGFSLIGGILIMPAILRLMSRFERTHPV
ncbi:hydrogenase expression protein HypA [Methanomicrobiaceae archaeon CYW5]|uniref:efflux RND transporter permease subunit n=1 Tax=Methanovulcanius yangii TaxID=1789227 RepID=UPI0029C9F287|nr:hydrophobe/amphiphile efflux-3 (HAE3) family transporter [Methanovulcanius yangii]MBT8507376.1 hydrogenase expression protein HypA [Methanovulcanius yangii]